MKKIWLILAFVALASNAATIVYENDFSTRTSAMPLPSDGWFEMSYVTGYLTCPGWSRNPAMSQDGWNIGQNSCQAQCYVRDVDGNQIAAIGSTNETQQATIKHSLGNRFSDGWVEFQIDMSASERPFGGKLNYSIRATLGDDKFYDSSAGMKEDYFNCVPFQVGIYQAAGATKQQFYLCAEENSIYIDGPQKGYWYRFVVQINMDTQKWWVKIYEMGQTAPQLSDPTPSIAVYNSWDSDKYPAGMGFFNKSKKLDADGMSYLGTSSNAIVVNDVTSIGLRSYYSTGGWNAANVNEFSRFDNVIVRHGATLDTLKEYYVNDFSTRKYRRAKIGTTTYDYSSAPKSTISLNSTNLYQLGAGLLATKVGDRTKLEPTGIDGWRRLHSDGRGHMNLYKLSNSYQMIQVQGAGAFAVGGVPFGSTITSGKVIAQVDARTPTTWDGTLGSRIIALGLGDDRHYYEATRDNTVNAVGRAARVGIGSKDKKDTEFHPSYVEREENGTAATTKFEGDVPLAGTTWYRIRITADLDSKTYSYAIYEQGTDATSALYSSPDGTLVNEVTGIRFNDASVNSLSTVSLWGYGAGGAVGKYIYFDNLYVWSQPSGSTAKTLLYYNWFTRSVVNKQEADTLKLVGDIDMIDQGQDEFVRRNSCGGKIYISKLDDDPVVEFANNAYDGTDFYGYALTPLGSKFNSGRLELSVDVRPPCKWFSSSKCFSIMPGSDHFYQGNTSTQSGLKTLTAYAATQFGFVYDSATTTKCRVRTTENGVDGYYDYGEVLSAIKNSNWYRFEAKFDLDLRMMNIMVYDMGSTKPTLATATKKDKLAAKFENLPMVHMDDIMADGGICTLGFAAFGTDYSVFDDKYSVLMDNVRVVHKENGTLIIVR